MTQVLSSPEVPWPSSTAAESCHCMAAVIWVGLRFWGFWRNLPKTGDFAAGKKK